MKRDKIVKYVKTEFNVDILYILKIQSKELEINTD